MQIVIDIPKYVYDVAVAGNIIADADNEKVAHAIRNGMVLPKGHGRLIDADALLVNERPRGVSDYIWRESHIYKLLNEAPTIIEADE